MYSNYSIIIDKGEIHEDYVFQIFRDLLSGKKSTFNSFIENNKDDWDTGREVISVELIHNGTEKYNNMTAAKEWTKTQPKDDNIIAKTACIYDLDKKLLALQEFKE